jgi:hypothetical protein
LSVLSQNAEQTQKAKIKTYRSVNDVFYVTQ